MRIDTSIPNTSWITLGMDIPYRYAYRHIRIAFKEPSVGFFERFTHIVTSTFLSVPLVGLVIAIAERIFFPPKVIKKQESPYQKEDRELQYDEALESVDEIVEKDIRQNLILNLVENNVEVETLTLDELKEIADNGKLWSLLNTSKKKVAEVFTEEHYKVLLENAHIATLDDRIDTLKSIIEWIPFNEQSQIEILKVICEHATPEMELVLQVKINTVRRQLRSWNLDSSITVTLQNAMKRSYQNVVEQREEREASEELRRLERLRRTFSFRTQAVREYIPPSPPINSQSPRVDQVMGDEEFSKLLNSPFNGIQPNEKGFVYKLLQSYEQSNTDQKQKIEEFMNNVLNSQLATMSVMNETISMHPEEMAALVKLFQAVNPSKIITLWDQLLKNKAAFLGEQGKLDNSSRIGAVFAALSDEQIDISVSDRKFEIVIRDYPKEAAKHLSPSHLDRVSAVIGAEALSELIPSLEETKKDVLYETLKVICREFPKHVVSQQSKVSELDEALKEAERDRQRFNLLKTKLDETKSQIITLERVLRVKIGKLRDQAKSLELLTLAQL